MVMRTLSFIFALIFAVSVTAQTPSLSRPFNEAAKFAKAGDFEKALANYRFVFEAAKYEPVDNEFLARLHFNLGVCEYRLNHLEPAIAEFDLATTLRHGNYFQAYYAWGMAELSREDWPGARRAFLEATKLNAADGEAWFDLAFAYLGERDFRNAEAAFLNSIKFGTVASALSHNNVGVIRGMHGDFSSARKEFETALKLTGGKLTIARDNLEYCLTHERPALLARRGFEFPRRSGTMF